MEFLGIGPLELFFIVIIALIILGPKDMVKAGRTFGKFIRQIITSDNWRMIQQASQEIRTLPNRFIRDAGLEDIEKELTQAAGSISQGISQTANDLTKGVKEATNIQADLGLNIKPDVSQPNNPDLSPWTNPEPPTNLSEATILSDWITPPPPLSTPVDPPEIKKETPPAQPPATPENE